MSTVHWDEVPGRMRVAGPMEAEWQYLGAAAGSDAVGMRRIRVRPGRQSTPQHAHHAEEETFYVLHGSGWSVQEDGCFAVGAGDAILYPARGPAHTVVAGDDGIDVLAFGPNIYEEAVRFPRSGIGWTGAGIVDLHDRDQFAIEAEVAGPVEVTDPPDPRPATIRNVSEVPAREIDRDRAKASARRIGAALGARSTALNLAEIAPGREAAPLHCHSAVAELFVVLEGDGALVLGGAGREEVEEPVRAGSVVSRPAGSGEAHAFRAGEAGMSVLMYSDRRPDDVCFYPRSGKVAIGGLGIVFRPELTGYWD